MTALGAMFLNARGVGGAIRSWYVFPAIVAGLVTLALPTAAGAHRLYYNGTWTHLHTSPAYFYNTVDNGQWRTETRDAQLQWHRNPLDMSSTSSHGVSRIQAVDNYYYGNFCGQAVITSYHQAHTHVDFNLNGSICAPSAYQEQAIACQEIGHALGLDHENVGDCMAIGYFSSYSATPGQHSINDLFYYYSQTH